MTTTESGAAGKGQHETSLSVGAQETPAGWRTIESAPLGECVLLLVSNGKNPPHAVEGEYITNGYMYAEGWHIREYPNGGMAPIGRAPHGWMPLPPPPVPDDAPPKEPHPCYYAKHNYTPNCTGIGVKPRNDFWLCEPCWEKNAEAIKRYDEQQEAFYRQPTPTGAPPKEKEPNDE